MLTFATYFSLYFCKDLILKNDTSMRFLICSFSFMCVSHAVYCQTVNVINSILLFLFINSFHYRPLPTWGLKRLVLISNLTFGAYLLSWIPDQIIYPVLNAAVKDVPDRIFNFPIYTGKTVLISLLLSFLIFVLSSCLKTAITSLQKKRSH